MLLEEENLKGREVLQYKLDREKRTRETSIDIQGVQYEIITVLNNKEKKKLKALAEQNNVLEISDNHADIADSEENDIVDVNFGFYENDVEYFAKYEDLDLPPGLYFKKVGGNIGIEETYNGKEYLNLMDIVKYHFPVFGQEKCFIDMPKILEEQGDAVQRRVIRWYQWARTKDERKKVRNTDYWKKYLKDLNKSVNILGDQYRSFIRNISIQLGPIKWATQTDPNIYSTEDDLWLYVKYGNLVNQSYRKRRKAREENGEEMHYIQPCVYELNNYGDKIGFKILEGNDYTIDSFYQNALNVMYNEAIDMFDPNFENIKRLKLWHPDYRNGRAPDKKAITTKLFTVFLKSMYYMNGQRLSIPAHVVYLLRDYGRRYARNLAAEVAPNKMPEDLMAVPRPKLNEKIMNPIHWPGPPKKYRELYQNKKDRRTKDSSGMEGADKEYTYEDFILGTLIGKYHDKVIVWEEEGIYKWQEPCDEVLFNINSFKERGDKRTVANWQTKENAERRQCDNILKQIKWAEEHHGITFDNKTFYHRTQLLNWGFTEASISQKKIELGLIEKPKTGYYRFAILDDIEKYKELREDFEKRQKDKEIVNIREIGKDEVLGGKGVRCLISKEIKMERRLKQLQQDTGQKIIMKHKTVEDFKKPVEKVKDPNKKYVTINRGRKKINLINKVDEIAELKKKLEDDSLTDKQRRNIEQTIRIKEARARNTLAEREAARQAEKDAKKLAMHRKIEAARKRRKEEIHALEEDK